MMAAEAPWRRHGCTLALCIHAVSMDRYVCRRQACLLTARNAKQRFAYVPTLRIRAIATYRSG